MKIGSYTLCPVGNCGLHFEVVKENMNPVEVAMFSQEYVSHLIDCHTKTELAFAIFKCFIRNLGEKVE